jgi:hypothetical protein
MKPSLLIVSRVPPTGLPASWFVNRPRLRTVTVAVSAIWSRAASVTTEFLPP